MTNSDLDQLNEYLQQEYPGPYTVLVDEEGTIKIRPIDSPEGFIWVLSSNFIKNLNK